MSEIADARRKQIEAIFREEVPESKCEIWDYETKVRCGVVIAGNTIEEKMSLRELADGHVRDRARRLAQRVAAATISRAVGG